MNARKDAAEQSREALLRAGEELLVEIYADGRLDPLQMLKPTTVAERAGRSKGMLYHLWPVPGDNPDRLAAYRMALAERLGWWRVIELDAVVDVVAEQAAEPAPQFLRQVSNWLIGTVAPGGERAPMHRMLAMLSIVAEARRGNAPCPRPDGASAPRHSPALEALYADTLQAYGREMVPPLTVAHLGAMLWAAFDGVALNLSSSPALADEVELEGSEGVWTSYALMVDAIVARVTRPVS